MRIFQCRQKNICLSEFPFRSPYIEKDVPSPEPSLDIFKIPRKEAPSGFPSQSPHRNRRSVPANILYLYLAVPGGRPTHSRFPIRATMERDAHNQGLLYIPPKISNKETPLQLHLEALRREVPITKAFYRYHLLSPVKDPPFQVPLSESP
jgi:hypothetical protein